MPPDADGGLDRRTFLQDCGAGAVALSLGPAGWAQQEAPPEVARKVLALIDRERVADLTLEMVKVRSETGHEGPFARYYQKLLASLGLEARLQPVEGERANVNARLRGAGGGPGILFYGHIDTIPEVGCVAPSRDQELVFGRGSNDQKGPVAAMTVAVEAIRKAGVRLRGDLWLSGAAGHEVAYPLVPPPFAGGDGTLLVARAVASGEIRVDYCIVTEGPFEDIKVAQGGGANFRLTITGAHAGKHTSTIPLSASTAVWGAAVVQDLYEYNKQVVQEKLHPLVPSTPRIEIGVAAGGDFYNRNPNSFEITGYRRWNPGKEPETVEYEFRRRLEDLRQRMIRTYEDPSIRFDLFWRVARDAADSASDPRTMQLVKIIQRVAEPIVGKPLGLTGSRAVSDLPIFFKDGRVPTVQYGPGDTPLPNARYGGGHTNNEGISIDRLHQTAQVYALIMLNVCGVA